ncbi:hypothetical protein NX722_20470 [Endozoicomonas gorgoniicola]|uniref:VHS domain-containing protein n=1 Tax=Endozoicomonas gorgoniicola TaxID=1234144 RepID=A0ABT3MZZ2_9GAMM|nr:hypothetical protein [Endozoicomonas gorgoniicola]MCW7554950.1 hypothetical protein [Endozoicomonas gorgoniicola]
MSSPPGKPSRGVPTHPYTPSTRDSKRPATTPPDTDGASLAKRTRHIPSPPGLASESPVTKTVSERTVSPHASTSVINEAAHTEFLKNTFAGQWKTVQAMRTQHHMLEYLDAIIHSLNVPESPRDALPFIIIHIDNNGDMNRLVPADDNAFQQQTGKAENARHQLIESMRTIDSHYNRERTKKFRQELDKEEATLTGLGMQLQAAGVTTPPIPKGFAPTSITEFLQTRVPNTTPERQLETPSQPAPAPAPARVKDNFHYQPNPAHKPEAGEPVFGSANPPERSEPPDYTKPDISPEGLTGQPPYLAEINKYRIFIDPAKQPDSVLNSAPFALQAGDPSHKASDIRYRHAHTTRKALLFELLMSLHRFSNHDEAKHLSTDIIRLIQLGIMSTGVSEQDLLNRKADPRAREECQNFLLQAESVTPPVAAFVADIVAGTRHTDSLAAKVMRDVIRLEDMRFSDDFDIDSLESNRGYPVPAAQKKLATRFCDQWRKLLANEGEMSKAARLVNRAEDMPPPTAGYQPEDDANSRERIEEDQNPYAKHLEQLNNDEQLRFLKQLAQL